MSVESGRSLSTRALRGVLWTASPFALQLFIGVLFYAFIPTAEMGRFEYALIVVMVLALLADLGLGSALVQHRNPSEEHFDSAFWTNLAAGAALTAGLAAAAPQLARLSGAEDPEQFARVTRVLVLLVPFAAVSGVFRGRLQKDLRFRQMAAAEAFSILVYTAAAVFLLQKYGVMAAVISAVVRELALLGGLWRASSWTPRLRFRLSALGDLFRFGINLTGSRCLNYAGHNLAGFVIFPLLGETALGYYRFAHRLTLMPLVRISAVVMRVFFPTFSAIQEDDALLRRGYLRAVQSIALFFWPLLAVFVFAPEALELLRRVDGRDLRPAALPLQLLAAAALLKAAGSAVGSIFLAKGRSSWLLYWSIFSLAVLLPVLFACVSHGVAWASAAIAATALLFLVLSQHLTNRLIGLTFADFTGALARPAGVAALVLAVLVLVRSLATGDALAACAAGALAWAAATLIGMRLLAWELCRDLWATARGRASGKPADPAGREDSQHLP